MQTGCVKPERLNGYKRISALNDLSFLLLLLFLFLHIIPLFLPKLLWRMGIVEKAVGPNVVP